jgi:hypothetical protein
MPENREYNLTHSETGETVMIAALSMVSIFVLIALVSRWLNKKFPGSQDNWQPPKQHWMDDSSNPMNPSSPGWREKHLHNPH